MKSHNSQP